MSHEAGKWLARIIVDEWCREIRGLDEKRGIVRTNEQWEVCKRLTMLVCKPILRDEARASILRSAGEFGENAARKIAREAFSKNVAIYFPN